MGIFMIRHTSVDVPQGICYGQTDVPVKPSFEEEAEIVKQNLAKHSFEKVYTSPLSRCTKLATYCGYPDAQHDNRLKEMHMGDWEMKMFDEITDPQIQEWYNDYLKVPTLNGESYQDLYARVSSFLSELKATEKTLGYNKIAIFAHGGVLICAQVYAGMLSAENALQKLPAYGEIVRITL